MRLFLLLLTLWALPSLAVVEGYKYQFEDPNELARFNALAADLRCPKCQNQDLADSNAPVASDMRQKVYELMLEGKSNDEIVQYMVDRYGDFVKYTPSFKPETVLLWFGPGLLLLFGLALLVLVRKNQNRSTAPLTAKEQARLQALQEKSKL
jgi:cytochrome c-type biogenesis protein CcmH